MNAETIQADVEAIFTVEFYSPYKMASLISQLIGRELKPQMLYQYTKKGFLAMSKSTTGKQQISRQTAIDWTVGYVLKNILKANVEAPVIKEPAESFV